MFDKFDESLHDDKPLPSLTGDDFEHEKMLDFGLPLRYSEIDWSDFEQRRAYCSFIFWFLTQLVNGEYPLPSPEEEPEVETLRLHLDQLHAEMRENARRAGLDVPIDTRSPFPELED